MSGARPPWRVWVDTGGTFTDCLAVDPDGVLHRAKVLSSSALRARVVEGADRTVALGAPWRVPPHFFRGFTFRLLGREHPPLPVIGSEGLRLALGGTLHGGVEPGAACELASPEEAPVLAARLVTGTPMDRPLPPLAMRLATTRGTNALLERTGAATALFITRGFGDLLAIGTQQRPDLFALDVRKPEPLYRSVVEVSERLAADGSVLEPCDLEALAGEVDRLLTAGGEGVEAAAVALLHSYRNPVHEDAVAELLARRGVRHVSRSAALSPLIKLLPRAQTAVVDAYLSPVLERYLSRVGAALGEGEGGGTLHVMTSAGGLARAASFRPKDGLLSGPAGGVVGAALAGRRSGLPRVIAFDMGGTSTDVARVDGDPEVAFEHRVGEALLAAPALAIESVAAGGGSICACDAGELRVGPESAGAFPGPACYGAGGPLTLTDVNLLLGRLAAERFEIPIDRAAAGRAFTDVAARAGEAADEALLSGFLEIADERMAEAIRRISVRRGYDPADYALVAFGGAGAQHACAVAGLLGIGTVLVPEDAGLLSALGLGAAAVERIAERQVLRPLAEVASLVPGWLEELGREAAAAVADEGAPAAEVEVRRRLLGLRFAGQEAALQVDSAPGASIEEAFAAAHRVLYGYAPEGRAIELESIRAIATSRSTDEPPPPAPAAAFAAVPAGRRRAWLGGEWAEVPAFEREALAPGAAFRGPALVFERHSATVVEPGWRGRVDGARGLVLERSDRTAAGVGTAAMTTQRPEAVELELFTHRFTAAAREMGEMLQRTAVSVNVKERLDFSCGLLDPEGRLVVNAPHIPVHLGALGLCVRRVAEALPLGPGDVAVTNHPAWGGSHLPDVTVVTPVHGDSGELLGWTASRAHHAEIGGTRPGSMPPDATRLAEEGVAIAPALLVAGGEPRWEEMRRLLSEAPHPSRAVAENLADLKAAVAANHRGAEALRGLARRHGAATVWHYMRALTARAEERVRAALARLPEGVYEALERLDDGTPIAARLEIRGGRAVVDLTGSGGVHPGNLNAPRAVVASAVLYVLRLLVAEPLPLNEGLLAPVELRTAPGLLDPPFPEDPAAAPAVVGGNVETSQRLVDTLLKALGFAACSQGTMNNVLFGSDRFGYYETVCGGAGAGPGWHGAAAVHTHMTNTRITDPEVLEHRYPVRLERFAIRRGSGGDGRFRGGDGAVREIAFLAPMSLSILSQHRVEAPYGMAGGEPGARGRQRLVRAAGDVEELASVDGREVGPGDRLILETPGGGGWGAV